MITLNAHESRVLGVLIEKAQTTQAQYPLTLNALVNGCNQKSNRDPVMHMSEDQVLRALDDLRGKQLVRELMMSGSRVEKYKHNAREALGVGTNELVILAELLMRGPQTVGELRGRASRMHPLETTEIVENILEHLMMREPALVRRFPPPPGSRAALYGQLLSPDLHRAPTAGAAGTAQEPPAPAPSTDLEQRVAQLERDVAELRALLE
ncbi:MAG: YceH family protein [Phycisphaerales bacterium]|nr:YceH family protein [Phycisphaerales bacterium]